MSDIPLARKELEIIRVQLSELADGLDRKRFRAIVAACVKLREIDTMLRRKPPVHKRARVKCRRVTPELVMQVAAYKNAHLKRSHFEIAKIFKLNPGRVSEILNGKKDHLLPFVPPNIGQSGEFSGHHRT